MQQRSTSSKNRKAGFAAAVGVALALTTGIAPAHANVAQSAPTEAVSLAQGATITRSTADNTLTPDDRARFLAIGLPRAHSAAVVIHKIKRSEGDAQVALLNGVARSLDRFAASEACDQIVATGNAQGMCTGHVQGPIGKVRVRMPIAAKLTQTADGVVHLVITNAKALEVKGLFSWSEVVAPGRMKVAYDLFPTEDGWLVQARVGVEMKNHEKSAKEVTDAMLKLESWLTRELTKA